TATSNGLEGVVVADTTKSDVDGERGRLTIAGHDVEALAGKITFEDVCGLLWHGALPDDRQRATIAAQLAAGRALAFAKLPRLGHALAARDGMDALRAALAHLRLPDDASPEVPEVALVTGAMALFAAAWAQKGAGQPPLAPDPSLSQAADYLRMVRGT